jgi:GWxTD domain-containing protein
VHLAFSRARLLFLREEENGQPRWIAEFEWRVVLRDLNSVQVGGDVYPRRVVLEPGERPDDPSELITVFQEIPVPSGRGRLEVTVDDLHSVRRGAQQQLIEESEHRPEKPGLSQVELLYPSLVTPGISLSASRAPDSHEDEVLASGKIPESEERVAFLFETYQLGNESRIIYRLVDSQGNTVRSRERAAPPGRQVVVRDTLSTKGLRESEYELLVEVARTGSGILEQRRSLMVQRPLLEWGEDAERTRSQMRLYAPQETAEAFGSVAPQDRKTFLDNVWKEMDPTPQTERNEFREEFERRLRFAEERWAAAGRRGWEVDIGRVYLAYGEPDEVREGRTGIPARGMLDETTDARVQIWVYRNPPVSFTFVYEPERGWVVSRDSSSAIPPSVPVHSDGHMSLAKGDDGSWRSRLKRF